jgi:hypothetical protein
VDSSIKMQKEEKLKSLFKIENDNKKKISSN